MTSGSPLGAGECKRSQYGSSSADDQRYWDLVTVCDLLPELDPEDWPAFDLARLERYVDGAIRRPISAVS